MLKTHFSGKMFLKEVSSAHQGCNYLIKKYKKQTNKKTVIL